MRSVAGRVEVPGCDRGHVLVDLDGGDVVAAGPAEPFVHLFTVTAGFVLGTRLRVGLDILDDDDGLAVRGSSSWLLEVADGSE
jgi:hypothetical protein